jgi:flagellar biosynthesis protein
MSSGAGENPGAAALHYSGEGAPRLLAKGDGALAERIIEIARQHDVPLVQDAQLTQLLCQLPLGEEIPPELYVAVAEVLAYVYRLNDALDTRA